MELELKHIAGYLPYKLRFYHDTHYSNLSDYGIMTGLSTRPYSNSDGVIMVTLSCVDTGFKRNCALRQTRPILRPYSYLTNKVLKTLFSGLDIDIVRTKQSLTINIEIMGKWFVETISYMKFNGKTQLSMSANLYLKLMELHVDVHGLIDAGLAIDINTLKK
tara:strand:+ start:5192 stop:5677 length:486 start_codon:yes stop_codon:yes gene_type:complete